MTDERKVKEELTLFIAAAETHMEYMRALVEESNVFVRRSDHRDIIIGAHLSRMTTTCQSVFSLCRLGHSHDAMALCRVLLEHNVNLIYLVSQKDAVKATHDFVFDSLTHVGFSHMNAAKHYPDAFPFEPEKAKQAIKLGEDANYQNRFSAQLEQLIQHFPDSYFDWYKELVYGDLSISTHPHASGLDPFAPAPMAPFRLRRPSLPQQDVSTAALAWAFTQSAYAWAAFAWGLSWNTQLLQAGVTLLLDHPNVRSAISIGMYLPDLPAFLPKPVTTKAPKKWKHKSHPPKN